MTRTEFCETRKRPFGTEFEYPRDPAESARNSGDKMAANKVKKVYAVVSKEEFRALLHRHADFAHQRADEDAEKWEEGLQFPLMPEDAAFLEKLRATPSKTTASGA